MTSSQIAKIAGVSRSTVSRVINGYSNVPPETYQKVMEVVKKYGYSPNSAARNLAGKPNRTVGLFFVSLKSKDKNIIHSSPFFSEFLTYFADALQNSYYHTLVSVISDERHMQDMISMFDQQMISGAVFMGDVISEDVLEGLSHNNHKCLLLNQRSDLQWENVLLLNTENYRAAYSAVEVLIKNGHRKIGHIAGAIDKVSTKDRFLGYRDCLLDHGIEQDPRYIVYTNIHREESGYQALRKMYEQTEGNLPTAIFCCNDLSAIGAMHALKELKIDVPRRTSLIGYDNIESSKYTSPPLSTVATSVKKLSEIAAETLLGFIETGQCPPGKRSQTLRDYELILRDSICQL